MHLISRALFILLCLGIGILAGRYAVEEGKEGTPENGTPSDSPKGLKFIKKAPSYKELCILLAEAEAGISSAQDQFTHIIGQLSAEQVEELLTSIDTSPLHHGSGVLARALRARMIALGPENAVAYALESSKGAMQVQLVEGSFQQLAESDPQVALKNAEKLTDLTLRYFAKRRIAVVRIRHAPLEGFLFAQNNNIELSSNEIRGPLNDWVERDLNETIKTVINYNLEIKSYFRSILFDLICDKLAESDPKRMVRIWKQLLEKDYASASGNPYYYMIKKWASVDPKSALNFLLSDPDARTRNHGLIASIPVRQWFTQAPDAAFEWLSNFENKQLKIDITNGLRRDSLELLSAEQIVELVEEVTPRIRESRLWEEAIVTLQKKDFALLLDWINGQPDSFSRNVTKNKFIEYMPDIDSAKMNLTYERFRFESSPVLMTSALQKWADSDPEAAISWVESKYGDRHYTALLGKLVENIADRDPYRAYELLDAIEDSSARTRYEAEILKKMVSNRPAEALNIIRQKPSGRERTNALHAYIRYGRGRNIQDTCWAINQLNKDEQAKVRYYELMEHITAEQALSIFRGLNNKTPSTGSLISKVAADDPYMAIDLLQDPSLNLKNLKAAQASIAQKWARKDMTAAVNWAMSIPPVDGENIVLNKALREISLYMSNPEFAKKIIQRLSDDAVKDSAILEIHKSIVNRDPKAAYAWSVHHASESTQKAIVQYSTEVLLNKNSITASEWVDQLPPGPIRDTGAVEIVKGVLKSSPEEALPWALSISDKITRFRYARSTINQWMRSSPEDAHRAVLHSNQLSVKEKQELLSMIEQ